MSYHVAFTPATLQTLDQQTEYIAIEQCEPILADRWLQRILTRAKGLRDFPKRYPLAVESRYRPYEIRYLNVDGYFLLYSIIESTQTVWIIGARHGRMQPDSSLLPDHPPE